MKRAVYQSLALFICISLSSFTLASDIPDYGEAGETCEMSGGVKGTCEEIGKCLQSGGIVRRDGKVSICSQQFSNIYVCCRRPHLVARELCDAWSDYWRNNDGGCATEHPLIVGGETANIGEFPHMVRIDLNYTYRGVNYDTFVCGGTLISPHFVLTAAHCFISSRRGITYWVKLGEHDLEHDSSDVTAKLKGPSPSSLFESASLSFPELSNATTNMAPVEQTIEVENIFIHPAYNPHINYHDIALLKLKNPATLTKRVLPACLPHDFPADDYQGKRMTVTGWGKTAAKEISRTLQKVEIPIVDRLKCSLTGVNTYRKTPFGITEDMLCAGETNRDSCLGDSGGPLSFKTPRRSISCEFTVAGVVSFGTGPLNQACGALGVYTRVSEYLDWITGFIAPGISTYEEEETEDSAEYIDSNTNLPRNTSKIMLAEDQEEAIIDSEYTDSNKSLPQQTSKMRIAVGRKEESRTDQEHTDESPLDDGDVITEEYEEPNRPGVDDPFQIIFEDRYYMGQQGKK